MEGGVVLIRRGHDPYEGRWALPSDFIEADESIEEAAIRECKEETAIKRSSKRGATHLFLDTSRGNPDAQEFSRACGFEVGSVAPLRIH